MMLFLISLDFSEDYKHLETLFQKCTRRQFTYERQKVQSCQRQS